MTRFYAWRVLKAVVWIILMMFNVYIYAGDWFFWWFLGLAAVWTGWAAFLSVQWMRWRRKWFIADDVGSWWRR